MTNSPHRDLDQSDVDADGRRMQEEALEEALEGTDGCDLFTVLTLIADAQEIDLETALDAEAPFDAVTQLVHDIIMHTQSDPASAIDALHEALDLSGR